MISGAAIVAFFVALVKFLVDYWRERTAKAILAESVRIDEEIHEKADTYRDTSIDDLRDQLLNRGRRPQ